MTRAFNIFRAHVEPMSHAVNLYVAKEDRFTRLQDREQLTEEGVVSVSPRRGEVLQPSFVVTMEAAQELFEQLWNQGFRSPHDNGNADKLDAARTAHIEDLRKVAKIA